MPNFQLILVILILTVSGVFTYTDANQDCDLIYSCNRSRDTSSLVRCVQGFVDKFPQCGEIAETLGLSTSYNRRSYPIYYTNFPKRNYRIFQQIRELQRIPAGK